MTWQDKCREKNMRPAVFPDGPNKGEPACQYFDASGHPRYAAAELSVVERIQTWLTPVTDAAIVATGKVIEATDNAEAVVNDALKGAASKINDANRKVTLPGLAGSLLGVPSWLVLGVVAYVGFRALGVYLPKGK